MTIRRKKQVQVKESTVPIDTLTPDPVNPCRHSERNLAVIQSSIEQFGVGRSVLIDASDVVRAGNGTLQAAKEAGITKVRIIETDGTELIAVKRVDLDGSRAAAMGLADNRASDLHDYDAATLQSVIDQVSMDYDLTAIGLSDEDLAQIIGAATVPAGDAQPARESRGDEAADEDKEVPERASVELQAKWGTGRGQLWEIKGGSTAAHRLMIGDSRNLDDVLQLLQADKPAICFTSPPYASQRKYESEVLPDWTGLMAAVFGHDIFRDDTQLLINLGLVHRDGEWQEYWSDWLAVMRKQGWRRFGWYIWDQGPGLPGDFHGRAAPAHEFIFHLNQKSRRPNKTVPCSHAGQPNHGKGLRNPDGSISDFSHAGRATQSHRITDSVFRVMRHKARGIECDQPAVFPVQLCREILAAWSNEGDLCYEPFSGSGTQLLAAEQTGRVCCAMEIEPGYAAIALERLALAGCTARRVTA